MALSARVSSTCETDTREAPINATSLCSTAPTLDCSIPASTTSPEIRATPRLNVDTSWSQPQSPQPALKFEYKSRPNLRFRQNASPLSPQPSKRSTIDWARKRHATLKLPNARSQPETSPITPGTVEKAGQGEDEPRVSNIIQRVEQKLWKYSASRNVLKRWLLEIISWSLSAICMATIIGVLLHYRNNRIPKWPLGLTLNAFISVVSKVASASLLLPVAEGIGQLKWSWFHGARSKKLWDFEIFDNASRGAWGSFQLLLRTKGKTLAALGAAVTLFALALDPFFQQVVQFPDRWNLQDAKGYIPVALSYMPFTAGVEFRNGEDYITLDEQLEGMAHQYFYGNGTTPVPFGKGVRADIPLQCSNSNCTWTDYETLGICNQCADVSELLEFKCMFAKLDWVETLHNAEFETGLVRFENGTSCGWYLKADEPVLMTGYNIDHDTPYSREILLMRAVTIYDVNYRELLRGYPTKLNITRNPLAHFVLTSGQSVSSVLHNSTPIAHECIVSWCAKTMSSTFSDMGYTEKVSKITTNSTVGPSPWVTTTIFSDEGEATGIHYEYLENVTLVGLQNTYSIDNDTQVRAVSLLDDVFPSSLTVANSTDDADAMFRYKNYITQGPFTRNFTYNPWLYNNISTHLDNMATAMTNHIRSAPMHTAMRTGSSYSLESYVDVRFAWLSFPLCLLGLSFIFLVPTVIRSSMEQDRIGVWKTSAIATLLYGLPDDMQKELTSSRENGIPPSKAKEIREIKIKRMPQAGWRFSGYTAAPPTPPQTSTSTPPPGWI